MVDEGFGFHTIPEGHPAGFEFPAGDPASLSVLRDDHGSDLFLHGLGARGALGGGERLGCLCGEPGGAALFTHSFEIANHTLHAIGTLEAVMRGHIVVPIGQLIFLREIQRPVGL